VEYPGHGSRWHESSCQSIRQLVETTFHELRPELQHPYAFLGHSFGATVAHEIARLIVQAGEALPVRLIVSGARAPHLPVDMIHHLPEKEFLERLIRFEGVPPEVLENKEALALLLPKVRHDFRLFVEHERSRSEPLPMPISALGGLQDPYVSPASMLAWSGYTSKSFRSRFFPGNHFFLFDSRFPIMREICEDLGASGRSDNCSVASTAATTPPGREQVLHP
jgi:medium-chain acyl-[acyl-carrier-protein] hydrolase